MTLSELQALSDSELIERVATEVMGWYRSIELRGSDWFWAREVKTFIGDIIELEEEGCADATWNPLTDWNHTVQVVKNVNVQPWHLKWRANGKWMSSVGDRSVRTDDCFWIDDCPQRAICMAALLATSGHGGRGEQRGSE